MVLRIRNALPLFGIIFLVALGVVFFLVEIEQLLKWSSLKPAFTRGGYRMGLKILVSSGFLSLIYYEKSFTKCFF